jgi:hypothetical protein
MILTLEKSFMTLGCLQREIKKFCRFFSYIKKRMLGAPPQNFLGKGIYLKNLTGVFEY